MDKEPVWPMAVVAVLVAVVMLFAYAIATGLL
jgi:hypothetical protein